MLKKNFSALRKRREYTARKANCCTQLETDGLIFLQTIKKGKLSFNANYKIEDCVDDMQIVGKIFSRESKIMRNRKQVGVITREFSIIADSFCLEGEENDIAFLTALVIAFDNIKDKDRRD